MNLGFTFVLHKNDITSYDVADLKVSHPLQNRVTVLNEKV